MKCNSNLLGFLLVIGFFILTGNRPFQTKFEKITVQEFEMIDANGARRASIKVEDEVVLRLMDQEGTIRVKVGANQQGSGLVLLDNHTEPGVHVLARNDKTSIKVTTSGKSREL
ncbi:MAG: hypothetical protein QM762_12950 [Chryseolinea sp.]